MTPFTRLSSIAVPLIRDNIDTDTIIPSREMRSTGRTGLAAGLFAPWRYSDVDARTPDSDFPLNDPRAAGAAVLLGGENFGCGSSREHAVWALAEWGIRAVIAVSYAPIFRANCIRNGLLPITLPDPAALAWTQVEIDLAAQTAAGQHFAIDAEAKAMLLEGLDVIDLTLKSRRAIEAWEAADRAARPWVYLARPLHQPAAGPPPHCSNGEEQSGPPHWNNGEVAPKATEGSGVRRKSAAMTAKPAQTISRARTLRRSLSLPEAQLWQALRARPGGLKFRRQHPAGPYILDFYCPTARLCVEVDGASHNARGDQDEARDSWLAAKGICTLRLPADYVLEDMARAVETIVGAAQGEVPLHRPADGPPPRPSGREDQRDLPGAQHGGGAKP
jgi:3-isopropylmalate/(R)-2-methylmalate dehydratase small subunit